MKINDIKQKPYLTGDFMLPIVQIDEFGQPFWGSIGLSVAIDLFGANAAMATALGLKAPLASPAFTGTPTAPTASPVTNSTQIATTAFVQAINTLLVASIATKQDLPVNITSQTALDTKITVGFHNCNIPTGTNLPNGVTQFGMHVSKAGTKYIQTAYLPDGTIYTRYMVLVGTFDSVPWVGISYAEEKVVSQYSIATNIALGVANIDLTLPIGYFVDRVQIANSNASSLTNVQCVVDPTGLNTTLFSAKTVNAGAQLVVKSIADHHVSTSNQILRFNASGNTSLGMNIIVTIKKQA
ncbi:MAG: hypothetical protein PHV20_12355 [Bacteroidales bacterium]|nr:hypothetical protein [Bacteroidales bacterium]